VFEFDVAGSVRVIFCTQKNSALVALFPFKLVLTAETFLVLFSRITN
jgi:hypothetical protein